MIAAQRARLAEAIEDGELLRVEMGTATTMDGDEVPWRARIRPIAFVKSPKGERLRCDVEPDELYMITSAEQCFGTRHWLLGTFQILD